MFFGKVDRLRRSIGFRLALWYAGFFVVVSVFLLTLASFLLASSLRQRDHDALAMELGELTDEYEADGLAAVQKEVTLHAASGHSEPLLIRMAGPDNVTVLLGIPEEWAAVDVQRLERLAAENPSSVRSVPLRGEALEVVTRRLADGSVLQIGKSTAERDDVLRRFWRIVAGVAIPVALLGAVGSGLMTIRALRPLRQLVDGMRRVEAGAVDVRVPTRGTDDELDELAVFFNRMVDRIATLIQGMRAALDNVAHDLRTPVARIRGGAEVALRADEPPADLREALADCVEECDRLLTMLNTLMEKGVSVAITAPEALWLYADANRVRQVLANLQDNAIKYTLRGGHVDVSVSYEARAAVVRVQANGVGIPPVDLPRVWDRLYRGDESRSQRGLGLGLSLVKAVVQAHGGRVDVSSAPGSGSLFTISLPLVLLESPEHSPAASSLSSV